MVFEIYAYPFGIMWRCKIDEILTVMSFYPWLSMTVLRSHDECSTPKKGVTKFIIFRPHKWGRKIMICVAFFFQILQDSTFYYILNLILRFTKEQAGVRKHAFPFVPARYIRTFDVISEVDCVFLRRKRRFENIELYPNFDVISEVNRVLPKRK